MSAPVVREFAEKLIKQVMPEAPFQPTIGVLVTKKDLPELWSTLEFGTAVDQRLTIGRRYLNRETNNFDVILLGKAGFGPDPLIALLGKFRDVATDLSLRLTDTNGRSGTFRLDSVGPPNSEPFEDGNWLLASVVCVYTYDSVRGAVA